MLIKKVYDHIESKNMQSQIIAILKKYNLEPKKYLGQNFLIDSTVLTKIIDSANISNTDTILEVGPGLGILTRELALRAKKVIACEKDRNLIPILKKELINFQNIEIVENDILKIATQLKIGDYKIVANLPYYLTARFLRIFLELANPPKEMTLMIQKEVAERICSTPPDMTLLAASVQYFGQPNIITPVKKGSFWPPPKVDSAILKISNIRPKPQNESALFFKTMKAGFSQPRKMLAGNLATKLKINREAIIVALKSLKINESARAQDLDNDQWLKLSYKLENNTL